MLYSVAESSRKGSLSLRAKISRSVTVVLLLTLIQSVAGPILIPRVVTPSAEAASACVLGTDYTKDTTSLPGFTILKFTKVGSCSFRNTEAITTIDYLVVGGGGGGGAHVGGGGGGGGVLQTSGYNVSGLGAFPITVGGGGTGAWVTTSWQTYGSNGGNSSINGVTAYGGGVGGIWTTYAPGYVSGTVGSAGGSGSASNYGGGTAGQGRAGGIGKNTQPHAAGGGGGAGQIGGNGTQTDNGDGTGGKGGDGIAVTITGASTYFGGGGGGGLHGNNGSGIYTGGAGGLGGGAAGASHSGSYTSDPRPATHNAASGLANTGGGGGGDGAGLYWVESRGGNGGSGIVIIRYANSALSPSAQDFAMTTNSSNYMYTSNSATILPGTISIMTLEAWIKPSTSCDASYHCMIFSVEGSYLFHVYQGRVAYHIGSGSAWCDSSAGQYPTTTSVPLDSWSHVALVRNGANVKIYINGKLRSNRDSTCSPATQAANTNSFYIGARSGYSQAFIGSIDEARIWSTDRSANIALDMHSNETSTVGLANYWNFNEGSGLVAFNQVPTAPSENDLTVTTTATWDADAISTTTISGVYTVRTFYRTYITATGGFTMPTTNRNALVVVVGGGGGGGGGGQGGGGGGGGVIELTMSLTSGAIYPIVIGVGGGGNIGYSYRDSAPSNGGNSTAFGLTAIGGGYGGSEYGTTYLHVAPNSGGSGGGGTWGNTSSRYIGAAGAAGQGFKGGDTRVLETSGGCSSNNYVGAGGGGAGAAGQDAQCLKGGDGGNGFNSVTIGGMVGGGGGGSHRFAANTISFRGLGGSGGGGASAYLATANPGASGGAVNGSANSGGGGGAGIATADTNGFGGSGGSGVVAIRWITSLKPSFTPPGIAYLNAGMTETFTTNVSIDSATANLTRTFRWESSTGGINGPYSLIKQGTGAANAFFSWIPQDTGTSGSTYAYRVVVTDSDTAGLFIVDTSTPVWAVINQPLNVSGTSSISKRINLSRNETFTITLGTSTYRSSLAPTIPGITLDTSTAGIAVLKIADTVTVGTYYETLTVIDSVSASVITPLTIVVSAPPTLLNTDEIVSSGLKLNLDAGNSSSFIAADAGLASTTNKWRDLSGNVKDASTGGTYDGGVTCSSPAYGSDNSGSFSFTGTGQCFNAPYLGESFTSGFTVEAWFKSTISSMTQYGSLITQHQSGTGQVAYMLGPWANNKITVSINGSGWVNCEATSSVTQNKWTHALGTYDGSQLKIYINGILENTCSRGSVTMILPSTFGTWIGKRWDTGSFFTGSIATARIYNRALSVAEALQNYNATKFRFDDSNITQLKPTKKYGVLYPESFTVTSGSGIKTTTFAVGDRTGIDWDTTTVTNQVKLSMQESLTATTHYETITVTDSLGASTYLPIKMTVSKADTLTISMDTKTVVTYNGSPITSYPKPVIKGLAGLDTFTVTTKFSSALYAKSATVPTNSDTYTVIAEDPVFGIGALSNYVNVVYETSTAVVNKAKQPALSVFLYGGTVGLPFPITVSGGGGDGAISETVTAGSSMTGCAITNHSVSASSTSQGFCRVYIFKAASQNYLSESITVDMYFMAYINNQPSGQVGSGSTIAINGVTSLTIDDTSTVRAPNVTSLSLTSGPVGTVIHIYGGNFGAGPLSIKFNRNKIATGTVVSGSDITVTVPTGAITGPILVMTATGDATTPVFTVTP